MNSYEAFLAGIKPACLLSSEDEDDHIYLKKLQESHFPRVKIQNHLTLFFQSEKLKYKFLAQDIEYGTTEYHRLMGLTLGYPPKAVDHFVRSWTDQRLWDKSVRFDYWGYLFSGHEDHIFEICNWLWSNVSVPPSPVKITKINGRSFFINP